MEIEDYAGILHTSDISSEQYYIGKQIGEGATSFVYLCVDSNNQQGAIKIFIDNEAYLNEITIFEKLQKSNNIVTLISHGEGHIERGCSGETYELTNHFQTDIVCYAIFEYLSNGELFNYIYLPKKSFEEIYAKHIFIHLLNAVDKCHQSGIIHGDIKLENIMLNEDFNVKGIDFGFSKFIDNGGIYEEIGTRKYSPPEMMMAATNGFDGIKSDIFALGVVGFILIIGNLPFDRCEFNDIRYKMIIKGDYNSFWKNVKYNNEEISVQVKDLINKMLCGNPKERINGVDIKTHQWLNGEKNINENNISINCCIQKENENDSQYHKEMEERKEIITKIMKDKESEFLG